MKKLYLTLWACASMLWATAQAPQKFNYQAVARNSSGTELVNQNIGIRITIHDGSAGGPSVYQETHTKTTNTFGLFTLEVGSGTVVSGAFASIDWANGDKYIQTELDPAGGSSYTTAGTTQLISVPYALHAGSADVNGVVDYVPKIAADGHSLIDSRIVENGTAIGVGVAVPLFSFHIKNSGIGPTIGLQTNNTGTTAGDGVILAMNTPTGQALFQTYEDEDLLLGTNGITRLRIKNSGNVGIGTNSPGAALHINSTNQGVAIFESALNPLIAFNMAGSAKSFIQYYNNSLALGNYAAEPFTFNSSGAERMRITGTGDVGIGTSAPARKLEVSSTSGDNHMRISALGGGMAYLELNRMSNSDAWRLAAGPNAGDFNIEHTQNNFTNTTGEYGFWTSYFRPSDDNGSNLGTSSYRWMAVYAANGTINTSDAREKTNVKDLNYGLAEVMKLRPVSYQWIKNPEQGTKIGFIAQEVQPVLSEVVTVGDPFLSKEDREHAGDNGRLGIFYSDIIPVLTKAIQEQQNLIDKLTKRVEELEKK